MLTWDRSHDYVLQRFFNDLTHVMIRFRGQPPSVSELVALRRCLPQYRYMTPAAVREEIGRSQELSLGELPSREARRLIETLQKVGLDVVVQSASYVSYVPFNRTTGYAWLIEDDAEAATVVEEMLAAGVPVEYVEA